ncbi:nickel/cobalt transporter [Cognatishimia sp. MH4019]|uniref:nickel/cobalt transporter n=1 Tax=Cognatishimia sp. MH4019 TaxID=2854030 RepID=UPI001CD1F19F|nr:hypothetical protein [Cognatishimia sp. MH4019]
MRLWIALGLLVAAALGFWLSGVDDRIAIWAANGQRDVQAAMASYLRGLRTGDAGAFWGLMGLCFAYGFFHAAGPGHGKLAIGGYGTARRVTALRLSGLALASSLAQAGTAVLLVYGVATALGWGRERVEAVSEDIMAPISYGAIALIGLWLLWRGTRALLRSDTHSRDPHHKHDHEHGHDHKHRHSHTHGHGTHDDGTCHSCGHKHAPTVEEAERVRSLRDALLVVGAVAIRPCTGALFLLILTWRLGVEAAGIAGAFAMGLGTATITIMVALLAVSAREGALTQLSGSDKLARVAPVLEILGGGLIVLVASQFLLRAL